MSGNLPLANIRTREDFCLAHEINSATARQPSNCFQQFKEGSLFLICSLFLADSNISGHGEMIIGLVMGSSPSVGLTIFLPFRMSTGSKTDNPVVLLWDVKADDLKLLINFMYEGQVNVAQERLSNFLALAERLQVRGLTTSDKNNGSAHPPTSNSRSSGSTPAKAPLQSPASGRRLRSSPMGISGSGHSASKRLRPSHMVDSDDLDDDLPPVKQVKL